MYHIFAGCRFVIRPISNSYTVSLAEVKCPVSVYSKIRFYAMLKGIVSRKFDILILASGL
jgi:hypothetical protein